MRIASPAVVLLASVCLWGTLAVAFPPVHQDFPLNDDWAFARSVFRFAAGDGIHYFHWASMPQLGQWLWACPFLWLLGPSHFALRVSTIVLSWVGLSAFHDLLRQEGVGARSAAVATAALAFNPLFFLLQGTFMTDVPALSFALAALALYGRAFERGRLRVAVAAAAVATLAAATRQNTVGVAGAAAVLLWRRPALRLQSAWLATVLTPAAAGVAVHFWFVGRADVRPVQPGFPGADGLLLLPFLVIHLGGLAAAPVLALRPRDGSWRWFTVGLAALGLAAVGWSAFAQYLPWGSLFPYSENMLTPFGAFAGSPLSGKFIVGDRPLLLGGGARLVLTAAGCVAGAALPARARATWGRGAGTGPILLFTLWQVPFLLVAPEVYDRYLLVLLPGLIFLAVPRGEVSRYGWIWASIVLVAFGLVSVGLMHDWLAWNSARWELGLRACGTGRIDTRDVEGGIEWDGWFAPGRPARFTARPRTGLTLPFTHDWFPEVTGWFALSFSELPGTVRVDAEPYSFWLLPGRRQFFLIAMPQVIHPQRRSPSTGRP
jgi:hypothetical protein